MLLDSDRDSVNWSRLSRYDLRIAVYKLFNTTHKGLVFIGEDGKPCRQAVILKPNKNRLVPIFSGDLTHAQIDIRPNPSYEKRFGRRQHRISRPDSDIAARTQRKMITYIRAHDSNLRPKIRTNPYERDSAPAALFFALKNVGPVFALWKF